jgi:hypothetical protein|nr:MAG TPA: baseplate protein [Caudoviricetes sp.]
MGRIEKNGVEYGVGGQSLIDKIYPVGSIYISTSSTFNPQSVWGGTWKKTADGRCLIGASTAYPLGSTGGNATHTHTTQAHTLTVNETAPHIHDNNARINWFNDLGHGLLGNGWSPSTNIRVDAGSNHTSTVGGGAAHSHGNTGSASNMQPYLVVYIWERTA